MKIIEITNKEQWDGFVSSQPFSQFAQSWEWADFQNNGAGRVWRLAVEEDGQVLAAAKLVKKQLFFGKTYLYCDRGPIFTNNVWQAEVGQRLMKEIEKIANSEKSVFLRFDPIFPSASSGQAPLISVVQMLSWLSVEKTIDIQPKKTAILDLTQSEEELLKSMHQKTRYNIRLAQKKGVVIEQVGAERFEEFWQLMEETRERDEFSLHGKKYYERMIGLGMIKLYFASLAGKPIAAAIISHYGDMATYVHGGSSNENREVMAPYLLQWTAVLDAKKEGLKYYDFYGVDEAKWPGVTRFKMGFNPGVFEYPGTHDVVFKKVWYNVYKLLRKIRRIF